MFIDYLINVAMAAAPYWTSAIIVYLIGLFYVRKSVFATYWSAMKVGSGILFIAGLILGMSSSSNTYKNTVDYNRIQDQNRIEQMRSTVPAEIVDRTRQPLADEALQERSVDMRERVNLDNQ
jgi:energy-coupling factor transporter transmembrane protein EcfT